MINVSLLILGQVNLIYIGNNMSNEKETPQAFYFLYKNNRRVQVSQEEWESSWLNWWKKNQKEESAEQ